jgi:hypothetical protein
MSPECRRELQRLLSALCDGQLTQPEHTRLEELLEADPECRREYLEYLDVHARLLLHPLGKEQPSPYRLSPTEKRLPQLFRYALVASITLAASLLVQIVWWHPHSPESNRDPDPTSASGSLSGYVATLTQMVECVWDRPSQTWRVGSRLQPGTLRLRQGIARIRFDSGPDLVIEGPAELRLDSSTAATMLRGKMVFRADETAPPFDLHTPSSTLEDFGTEYAVVVGPEGEEVHVFDGEVQRTAIKKEGDGLKEYLKAGEARRYGASPMSPGLPTALDPARFVRQVSAPVPPPDPAAGLLAYEGFDYKDPMVLRTGKANGGLGWISPWMSGFARPLNEGDRNVLALNVKESLVRAGAAEPSIGGCFDYTGFAKYHRRLATPVRLDSDGVYYLSFLFRRHGPPADPLNAVAVLLRTTEEIRKEDSLKRLNVGVGGVNQLFTHLNRVGSRTPLPLSNGVTYLLVAKIVASRSNPDQVFMRVYAPEEPIDREEPGSWSVVGPPFQSDLVFDWLEAHINSKTRQILDELRLGTTWSSVTAPWLAPLKKEKQP